MTTVTIETDIAAPPGVCFDLARDVATHARTAAFSGETLVAPGRLSGLLETGDLVAFEGTHLGFRHRFVARMTEMERPHRFVDEMVEGIFRSLRHEHLFEATDGGTIMRDILVWRAPLGILGSLADALFLRRHMENFVRTKQQNLRRIAESMGASALAVEDQPEA